MPPPPGSFFVRPRWLTETPFWAVSALLHLVLMLVLLAIPLVTKAPEEERIVITMKQRREPPPYDPTKPRELFKKPEILDPRKIEKPVVQRKIEEVPTEIPKGSDADAVSNYDLDASLVNIAIGALGGASSALGDRLGRGTLVRDGGSDAAEPAVRAALEWLRRHQHPDGYWSAADYTKQCKTVCRNKDYARYGDDKAFPEHSVGVTALAMLAFSGYGQTHRDGDVPEFVECQRRAVLWLKSRQQRTGDPDSDGRFGSGDHEQWIYDHAIATMAMAELLVMSNDAIGLKRSVEPAVRLCLRAQNDGFGWRYGIKPLESDTSVTGWMVLALKTAKRARLGIPKEDYDRAFRGALRWFDAATNTSGRSGYFAPGDEGSRLASGHPEPYPFSKELSCMTAVSVLCRIFGGEKRSSRSIRDGIEILMAEPPKWQEQKGRSLSTINLYHWYYASYALHQFGGREWQGWSPRMVAALVPSQRRGGDEDGSWDPIGEWGIAGGRVYSTAIAAMTLEVFYRYYRHADGSVF